KSIGGRFFFQCLTAIFFFFSFPGFWLQHSQAAFPAWLDGNLLVFANMQIGERQRLTAGERTAQPVSDRCPGKSIGGRFFFQCLTAIFFFFSFPGFWLQHSQAAF
ncbi:hypothetical protein CJ307_33735, partial [Klebsiella quasipneumoniae]